MKKNYVTDFIFNKSYNLKAKRLFALIIVFISVVGFNSSYAQQSYTFTSAGATGSVGPTQTQVNTAYLSTNLNGSVVVSGGIQLWRVPATGNYGIEALGASGGGVSAGLGAKMRGDIFLNVGDTIIILPGQMGIDATDGSATAGGGSFVMLKNSLSTTTMTTGRPVSPLVIAGGGGGNPGTSHVDCNASLTTSANAGNGATGSGVGGVNGNGGGISVPAGNNRGGGGGGYLTDGEHTGTCGTGGLESGSSFLNGGAGGLSTTCSTGYPGGFGGGGGAISSGWRSSGGGGGYSGGGAGQTNSNATTHRGGGGGSLNTGSNQVNAVATSTGHGRVVITKLCSITLSSTTSSSINAICSGNSATLTTNAINNYSWSTGSSSSSVVVSPTVTTVYTLSATSPSNCTAEQSLTITVNSAVPVLSVANTASASGGICPTETVILTASGALSHNWSGGSIPVTNGVVFSPTSAVTYTVSGVNGCGTTTAVTSVSVHPFPTVNPVASSSTLCAGSGLTLTATGNATNYVWSGGSAPSGNGVGFVPPASANSYSVIGTSALSCTALATIPVTVFPTPINPPTANPALICIGGSSTLSATGALNYTWTSATQTVNTADFIVSPTVGVSTYTVTKSNSSCVNTQVVSVVTNSLPTIFAIVTPTVVCALTPATLAVGGALTYTWTSPGPPSYTFTGASPVVSPVAPSTYSVAASDGTCISTTTVFLNANPNPTIVASASTPTTCGGEVITLNATGGVNYTWTSTNGGTFTAQSFTDAPTIPTAYNVTGDNSFGCFSGASQVVLVLPSPTITASSAVPLVCNSSSVVLTASGAGTYTWSTNAGGVNTNTALVNPTNTTSGPVMYTVQGTSASNACQGTETVLVNVFIPTLTVGGNTNTCAGGSVTLAIIGGTSNYNWNTGTSNVGLQNITASLTAPAVFTLSANTLSAGVTCPSTNTVELGIYFNPTITAVAERTTICKDESVDITAGGGVAYNWNTGSTNTVLTVSPIGNIINYTVTGIDANGCSNTATVQIKISGCVGVPELNTTNAGLNIYPNPNNGVFNIEANTAIKLNLVNELGQLVRVITLSDANNYKVSVTDLTKGVYFIAGQKDAVQIYQKIVVTR